jgi:hypothetical protein
VNTLHKGDDDDNDDKALEKYHATRILQTEETATADYVKNLKGQ